MSERERCPLCLKMQEYHVDEREYLRFQNTARLVCAECEKEVRNRMRPTWTIVGNRVFPCSSLNH